ncbi:MULTISPECIES: phage tail terminator family protein [Paenibacillus]|uniref:Phage protein n=1 Tax=Paenibacillus azoreducens TaxID=116718 RepID=A0A920CSD8_9BACL|nr:MULTISPECIES: hypothetical protein [Paenibacillus]MBE9913382.1 hypothetical protein [Paenibacillus donghaensis]GIO47262.1 hypothetical protein J34TS1_20270 [Paenibacillus azoreducens]
MKVTYNDVRNAVHAALNAAFPQVPISGEEIKQDLDPPRFFVRFLEPSHKQELGQRYRREHPFVVQYFSTERGNEDMYAMAEELTTALKWIDIGGRRWPGKGMYFKITEEVLHFFVTYSLLVWEHPPDTSKMQTLKQEGNVHG